MNLSVREVLPWKLCQTRKTECNFTYPVLKFQVKQSVQPVCKQCPLGLTKPGKLVLNLVSILQFEKTLKRNSLKNTILVQFSQI